MTTGSSPSLMLSDLLKGLVQVPAANDCAINGISLDSRAIAPGMLFIACAGGSAHGLDFLQSAIDQGAAAVLCEPAGRWSEAAIRDLQLAIPLYVLEGLGPRVSEIAGRFYRDPSQRLMMVGVTGTNGKTSTTHYIAQALAPDLPCALIGTVGNGFPGVLQNASHTTPDPVGLQRLLDDFVRQGARAVAMEVSSHALDQGRAAAIAFDVAVLTNLTQDHLDYHGSMAAYGEAKRKLFVMPGLKCAVINLDDPYGRRLIQELDPQVQSIGYGFMAQVREQCSHWLQAVEIKLDCQGMCLSIESSWGKGQLSSTLLGRFNAHNLLAVLAVMLASGIDFETALSRLAHLTNVDGRMERLGGQDKPLVVIDYAHTPDALEQALKALQEHVGGRLVCVFGCGGDRDSGKRPQMGAIAERLADQVIVTDDNPRTESGDEIVQQILAGMARPETVRVIRDRATAIKTAIREAAATDLVLVAGKGHETYQLVGDQVLHFSDREQVQKALAEVAA